MFGIGFSEFFFVILAVLMLFGSKEIPQIARFLGKTMAQLRNATNDLKSEIQKSAADNGMDMNSLTGGISEEINKAKEGITNMVNPMDSITSSIQNPVEQAKEDIENLTGPIKRQL